MKFSELAYIRPAKDESLAKIEQLTQELLQAEDEKTSFDILERATRLQEDIISMSSLSYIRHSVDTRDEFYKAERDYFDEAMPTMMSALNKFMLALLDSPHRDYLEGVIGKHAFDLIQLQTKTISEDVLEDLVQENKLASEYDRLIASAQLEFDGEIRNLAQMIPYMESEKRETRRDAFNTYYSFFKEHEEKMDDLYDQLVKVRHKIALTLGFNSFIELAYARMGRTDYDHQMVATYRDQVRAHIVPIAAELREKQRKLLGLDRLYFYDEPLADPKGNPTPKGDADQLMDEASTMFRELSPDTDAFFSFMRQSEAMDLLAKPGKESGGYCTFLPNWKMPFIFANFNGTKGDVEVFTHEGGHAYHAFVSRDDKWGLYHGIGMETAEVHSMSMEFLTWPWMDRFFGEDADRFRYHHLVSALLFIPYGVAVDHFQQLVFENPEVSPDERKKMWLEVEKLYLPTRDYDDMEFLQRGNVWKRQGHIFGAPFYYIDYTLAQVMAFWFWKQAQEDPEKAWQKYDQFCRDSGLKAFRTLLAAHDMPSPFDEGSLGRFIPSVHDYVSAIDPATL